ncbi:MAG: SGNH/GDSL hydrolase family protein [Anaerolineae bacterium]|nr:SGNH/GDSL hydrolase family protein [Anaerolineae bacterium]
MAIRIFFLMLISLILAGCNLGDEPGAAASASTLPTPVFIRVDYTQAEDPAAVQAQEASEDNPTDLPQAMVDRLRAIYADGLAKGKRAGVFSKVGDSITVSQNFLTPIGYGQVNLAQFTHLQPTIEYFTQAVAREGNAFVNPSLAAGVGWAAWGVLDPELADATWCGAGESPLACEYRVVKPTIALIMFGTNDSGYRTSEQFRSDMQRIVQYSLDEGIIPILSTVPNRPEMPAIIDSYNRVIGEIAASQNLPVWDYHSALRDLPNSGLTYDNIHPSSPPNAPETAADFQQLSYGYNVRNLTALQMLDVILRVVG